MHEIVCRIPSGFIEEKKYVIDIISEFTGLKFTVETCTEDYEFIMPNGKKIVFRDSFFGGLGRKNTYIDRELIPDGIKIFNCGLCENMPVIYGNDSFYDNDTHIELGIDIFGSIFFMLSRWEEVAVKDRDDHGRFPGQLSFAAGHGFIRRPVVDENILLLKKLINKLDPSVKFKEYEPKVYVTSDVDSFDKFMRGKTLKMFAGHLLKRCNPFMFASDLFKYGAKLLGVKDPYDKFGRICSIAGKFGTKPVFFILAAPEGPYNDGWFTKLEKDTAVFRELAEKGAGIGLHYGYFSLLSENNIRGEKFELEKKYSLTSEKGRAHFLQFDVGGSYDVLVRSGIKEDYTMGYSRYTGFRCGTGRTFRPWDFSRKCAHEIIEHPLIVMDTTLYAHGKMKKDQITSEIEYYLNISRKFSTDLTILIHNSSPAFVFEAIEKVKNNLTDK